MNQAIIDRLDQCFADAPTLLVGGPVPDVEIREAETLLGVEFVPDYRWFVRTYGGAMVGSLPVYGLRTAEVMGTGETVVTETARFRKDAWPSIAEWIVISDDGYGNPIGMDKDGAVYLSDHDSNFEIVTIASSFEEFLARLLDGRLYGP